MIDIHTHVFNLRHTPTEGILKSYGVPERLAKGLAKLFERLTQSDPNLDPQVSLCRKIISLLSRLFGGVAEPKWLDDPDIQRALSGEGSGDAEALEDAAPLARALEILQGLDEAGGIVAPQAWSDMRRKVAGLLWDSIRNYIIAYLENVASCSHSEAVDMATGYIRLFLLLHDNETDIVERLIQTYGTDDADGPKIDLFVHHTLDMKSAYKNDEPHYPFREQLDRMRKLAEKFQGRILGFVAFDPRRQGALEMVEDALNDGFCGVKVYPPDGYAPDGNGGDVDEALHRLYDRLKDGETPILTHASDGGFIAPTSSETYADPCHWGCVLEDYPDLRLCLGHAGGGAGWFAPMEGANGDEFNGSWAATVVDLCTRYPNVYCDFAYLEDILEAQKADILAERLTVLVAGNSVLGTKIMYGSDWHMLFREKRHGEYVKTWLDLFSRNGLSAFRDAFFHENAKRFLNLPAFLTRCDGVLSDQEKTYLGSL